MRLKSVWVPAERRPAMGKRLPNNGAEKTTSGGKRARKIIIILLIAFVLLVILIGAVDCAASRNELIKTRTSYGTGDDGYKAIYLAAEKYLGESGNVSVQRFGKLPRFLPEQAIVVLPNPDLDDGNFEKLLEKVEQGMPLVILPSDMPGNDLSALKQRLYGEGPPADSEDPDENGFCRLPYENGAVYVSETVTLDGIRNGDLKAENGPGSRLLVFLADLCGKTGCREALFDETYLGLGEDPTADILGWGLILGLIELGIAIVLLMLSLAQRFGAPKKLPEMENRNELEHIAALADMYRRTGSECIAFKIHMDALMDDVGVATGMPPGGTFEEIYENAIREERFKDSGLSELADLYRRAEDVRIPRRRLEALIEEINRIRREYLT